VVAVTTMLPDALGSFVFGAEGLLGTVLGGLLASVLVASGVVTNAAVVVWGKRKIMAAIWGKVGPNRMGPFGLLIIAADAVRLMSKELIVPEKVDRPAWDLAPIVVMFSALFGFAVIPMGTVGDVRIQIADPETGVVFAFAVASLATLGITMAGYASRNKFSMLGALRAVAQNVAYEIPLVVVAASVVLFTGSMQTSEIVAAQQETLVSVAGVSIPAWFAFVNPLAFGLFVVANLAEVGRNPFDTPEAPTEIVAGYQTEYGSVYFALLYAGEFVHMFFGGALVATLFLGGPAGPVLPGVVWFGIKMWSVFLFTQWARASLPRVRIDQLIEIGWKGLLVLSFLNLVLTAVVVGVVAT
jgi:NADH-quinone oxidoreductase subunit H